MEKVVASGTDARRENAPVPSVGADTVNTDMILIPITGMGGHRVLIADGNRAMRSTLPAFDREEQPRQGYFYYCVGCTNDVVSAQEDTVEILMPSLLDFTRIHSFQAPPRHMKKAG